MKIDIIGVGSLGLLLAGKLTQSGNEVRLWCRGIEQCRQLEDGGLNVSYEDNRDPISISGDRFASAPIEEFTDTYLREPSDWIIVTVKQNTLHNALPEILSPLKAERVHIICFQNGIGHMEMLRDLLPKANLYAAVTTEAAKRKSLTEVIHAGAGEVWIGKWSVENGQAHIIHTDLQANYLIEVLTMAGFSAFLSNEVDTMIYRKLLINAVINPLTAIWRIPNGELLASEGRLQLMRELFREATMVYDACGVTYDEDAWDNILEVCRITAGNISSMLADVLASRTTEIRWINGSLVEMAERTGTSVPLHRWICQLVEGIKV
ncbi:2-dehydropantoate 2-reductase [Paenibacillus sp.]|uniref:ketopantoate reductase family protein n=1 Tax=Paenibacillus sp. TaxID=58172 RepID=UPI0028A991FF|nr:2-dehydropantoate 2-reductase [Paenibacillus sp.]